jgi:hypothetical protein
MPFFEDARARRDDLTRFMYQCVCEIRSLIRRPPARFCHCPAAKRGRRLGSACSTKVENVGGNTKKPLFVVVGAGVLLVVFAGWFAVSANSSDEAGILRIETQTAVGEQQNDISMMRLFAEDYIAAGVKVLTKKQFEENVKRNLATHENGTNPYTIEKKNVQIYLFGDTAEATYLKEYRQIGESSHAFTEDDTDILTRTPNGWVIRMTRLSRPTR